MPKTFTENERNYIKKRLMEEAEVCMLQFGIRKTTVDELVNRVKIPKGTFYLFYKSKELLFFDVFLSYHDKIQSDLLNQINTTKGKITEKEVTELIYNLYKKLDQSFLYPFIINGELEYLMRKLPSEVTDAHIEQDDFSLENLLVIIPGIKTDNIKIFSAALRAIFCSMLHKREIGEEFFDDALMIMIHGVIIQMFKREAL